MGPVMALPHLVAFWGEVVHLVPGAFVLECKSRHGPKECTCAGRDEYESMTSMKFERIGVIGVGFSQVCLKCF